MTIALFPGFFDPVTNGHLDIARRAANLFDGLVVGIADSAITHSSTLFDTEERVRLFEEAVRGEPKISVMPYTGLTVDFARKHGATVLIRSMRGNTDFENEFDQALMNRQMAPEIESVYLIASLANLFISGTRIREVAALGYDVSDFVPAHVVKALKKKLGED
jgi:pantetheine-phosphate adenylyltransferase